MVEVRPGLEAFAGEMLGGLARADQRAKGGLYLRGLMLDGKRKSMQPMAARLGVDHQQLQQFVTSSTWDHVEVRRRLARWADGFVAPQAYVVDDSGFPKDGVDSPGVARQYCGALGKTGNCQVGVSVHAVTDCGVRGGRLAAVLAGVLGRCQRGGRRDGERDSPTSHARQDPR